VISQYRCELLTSQLLALLTRYGIGTDREEESKVDRALEEDDKKKMAEATWVFDGQVGCVRVLSIACRVP
jgi:hypothetical protein